VDSDPPAASATNTGLPAVSMPHALAEAVPHLEHELDVHPAATARHSSTAGIWKEASSTTTPFYYHTPMYRPEAAMDGWEKVFSFFGRHLKG
jgi:dienelactone hydrolase